MTHLFASSRTLRVEDRGGGVVTVTMDSPPVNPLNSTMQRELISTFDALSDYDGANCIVLTGAGKVFSAGADLHHRPATDEGEYIAHNRNVRESFFALTDCTKPVIAALNGPAIGAGFGLAACADIILASEAAWVQMPEVNLGLAGGAKFLERHFSRSDARLLFFTARKFGAMDLLTRGVVSGVYPHGGFMKDVLEVATEIANKDPRHLQILKSTMNVIETMPFRDAYRHEQTVTKSLAYERSGA